MAQNYTIKDWLAFMEVYGMPLRIGKYDPNTAKEPERMTLRTALSNLGHDAAAMIPDGMDIEIIDINRGSGSDSLFGGLATYLDKQVSKGVLGQTMTTDDGSSLAQAKEHGEVKQDFLELDALALGATVNAGNTRPWCQLNYGENAPVCETVIDAAESEDLQAFTKSFLPWVEKTGLRAGAAYIRDKFGVPDPDEAGESEVLGGKDETVDPYEVQGPDEADEDRDMAAARQKDLDLVDMLSDQALGQWERVIEPHRRALKDLAARSSSYEEFAAGLDELTEVIDSDPFVALLREQLIKARGVGAS